MKKIFLLLLLQFMGLPFLSAQSRFNQTAVRDTVLHIADKIAKENILAKGTIWKKVSSSPYHEAIKMISLATVPELKALARHPNAVVQCYALNALAAKNDPGFFPLLLEQIGNTQKICIGISCHFHMEAAGDYLIGITNYFPAYEGTFKLDGAQKSRLDSVLLYTPNVLEATDTALQRLALLPQHYNRIRELALQGRPEAVVALAKYRNEQDANLVMQWNRKDPLDNWQERKQPLLADYIKLSRHRPVNVFYRAVAEFPHPRFMPVLEKHLTHLLREKDWPTDGRIDLFYTAVAAYRNQQAMDVFSRAFREKEQQHRYFKHSERIFVSLAGEINPVYESLAMELWKEHNYLDQRVIDYFWKKDSLACLETIKHSFGQLQAKGYFNPFFLYGLIMYQDTQRPGIALNRMLELAGRHDPALEVELIAQSFASSHMSYFSKELYGKVKSLKDQRFVDVLMTRLKTEGSDYEAEKIMGILLMDYGRKDLYEAIVAAINENSRLNNRHELMHKLHELAIIQK